MFPFGPSAPWIPEGRTIRLSLPRRLVVDLVHFGHKVPTVPVQKVINIGALAPVRSQLDPRPSWCTLFTKAYALVALEFPELRRSYMPLPWARLYEHPETIVSIAVERQYQGENGVFFGHVNAPEKLGVMALEAKLRHFKDTPVESVEDFWYTTLITRLPKPLRRFLWWYVTQIRGFRKSLWLGTFGISVYSGLGAESLHPISPLTTVINYGVIQPTGEVTVRIVYDHRAMDGSTIARALGRLEKVMNGEILAELRSLAEARDGTAAQPVVSSS